MTIGVQQNDKPECGQLKKDIVNIEQFEYWNEKSGPKWVKLDDSMNERFSILTEELFSRANINENDRVLDIGCGGGQTSFQASQLVGYSGQVLGADISEALLNLARSKFSNTGNLDFSLCDAQNHKFQNNEFDKIISRFGVMFFEDPVEAFRNIYRSLKVNGSLNFVCWSDMIENEFLMEGADIITKHTQINLPPLTREPGPFAFREKSYIEEILSLSGFKNIKIDKVKTTILTKDSVEQAAEILMNIGPRAKMLSQASLSDEAMHKIREQIEELCKTRLNSGEISYAACLNFASATR